MTKIKTLTALIILSTAVASPAFAKASHKETFRRAYDQVTVVPQTQGQRNTEDFGFSGMDRSFPGGEDPSLNPPGT